MESAADRAATCAEFGIANSQQVSCPIFFFRCPVAPTIELESFLCNVKVFAKGDRSLHLLKNTLRMPPIWKRKGKLIAGTTSIVAVISVVATVAAVVLIWASSSSLHLRLPRLNPTFYIVAVSTKYFQCGIFCLERWDKWSEEWRPLSSQKNCNCFFSWREYNYFRLSERFRASLWTQIHFLELAAIIFFIVRNWLLWKFLQTKGKLLR